MVAQMAKNLPAMQETWVQSLGWEDHLEEGITTHSSILDWRIPIDREPWWVCRGPWGRKESDTSDRLNTAHHILFKLLKIQRGTY